MATTTLLIVHHQPQHRLILLPVLQEQLPLLLDRVLNNSNFDLKEMGPIPHPPVLALLRGSELRFPNLLLAADFFLDFFSGHKKGPLRFFPRGPIRAEADQSAKSREMFCWYMALCCCFTMCETK